MHVQSLHCHFHGIGADLGAEVDGVGCHHLGASIFSSLWLIVGCHLHIGVSCGGEGSCHLDVDIGGGYRMGLGLAVLYTPPLPIRADSTQTHSDTWTV